MHRCCSLAACLVVALASHGWADEAPDAPHAVAPFVVKRDKGAKNYRLVIPQKHLKELQMAAVDPLDPQVGSTRTILAGVLMMAAAGSCLLLLKPAGALRWVAPTVLVVCAAGAAGLAFADLRVDPEPQPQVTIEVTPRGDAVVVTLPGR